jgi:hypothetical protein
MVCLKNLPIVTITEDNIKNEWDGMIERIKASTFIAIDIVIIIQMLK